MRPLSIEQMHELLSIMSQMKQMASSHSWQELSQLDSERLALLRRESSNISNTTEDTGHTDGARSNPVLSECDKTKATLKYRILALDKDILDSLQADRAKLLTENRGLNAQLNAKSVYAQSSSMSL